jgi:hypothetical protein
MRAVTRELRRGGSIAVLLALGACIGSCARRDPRVLSAADGAAGCSAKTPLPCEALCFQDRAAACAIFGQAVAGMADAPVRLPEDLPRGRKALHRGCDLGNLDACRELVSYDSDTTTPAQYCGGWESICRRGDLRSCTFFAQCLDHVDGFRRDRAEALRLFQQGCAQGERVACRQLGFLTAKGEVVPQDFPKAFAFLDQACRMDDQLACANEGLALEHGSGAPRDVERAKALYRGACARGIRPVPCEGLRRLGETPPSTVVTSADAAESSFVSTKFDYEWRLPANWEFVAPKSLELADASPGIETVAAHPRGGASTDSMQFAVTDYVAIIPGKFSDPKKELTGFEDYAKKWFLYHGVSWTGSAPTKFLYMDALRADGQLRTVSSTRYVTMLLFLKDRRRFELLCLTDSYQQRIPCADAIGALMIHERKPEAADEARVLHLREPRYGLSFDAPSDVWLAHGPRTGFGGLQTVWIWANEGRQIDISVLSLPDSRRPIEVMVAVMAESFRKGGATVSTRESTLAGQPCHQLVIDKDEPSGRQDFFLQQRGHLIYGVLVSAPAHDPALLESARAGLRIEDPAPDR